MDLITDYFPFSFLWMIFKQYCHQWSYWLCETEGNIFMKIDLASWGIFFLSLHMQIFVSSINVDCHIKTIKGHTSTWNSLTLKLKPWQWTWSKSCLLLTGLWSDMVSHNGPHVYLLYTSGFWKKEVSWPFQKTNSGSISHFWDSSNVSFCFFVNKIALVIIIIIIVRLG